MTGRSLIEEYKRLAAEYAALDLLYKLSPEERASAEVKKLELLNEACKTRAMAVNDFLNLIRWTIDDSPGALEDLLVVVVDLAKTKNLRTEVRELVKVELEPVRKAYMELKAARGIQTPPVRVQGSNAVVTSR